MIDLLIKKFSSVWSISLVVILLNIFFAPYLIYENISLIGGAILICSLFPLFFFLDKVFLPKFLVGPALLIYIYHFLGYVFGPILQHYYLQPESFIFYGMIFSQKYAYLGLIIFLVAYPASFVIVKRLINKFSDVVDSKNFGGFESYGILLILASFFLIFFGYFSETSRRIGGIGGADKSLIIQSIYFGIWYCQFVGFFFLGYFGVQKGKPGFLIGLVFCLIYFAYQITEGSRGPIAWMFFSYGTGAVWAGFSKRKIIFLGSICAVLLVLLAGPVDLYRSKASQADYSRGLVNRVSFFHSAAIEFYQGQGSIKYTLKPFVVAVTALTVDRIMVMTPSEKPFVGTEGMDALLNLYIPKFIKPNRLDINDGHKIAEEYGLHAGTKNTFFYVTAVGEGYRRFGWVGIVLLYGFSGIFYGMLCSFFWGFRRSRVGLSMLFFLLLLAPGVWSFTFNYAIYFFFFVVPKYLLVFIFFSLLADRVARYSKTTKAAS